MKVRAVQMLLLALGINLPSVFSAEIFTGLGDSMEPIFHSGQKIVLSPLPYSELRPGLVVMFMSKDCRPTCHILVQKWKEGWVTKGCNNCHNDENLMTPTVYMGIVSAI